MPAEAGAADEGAKEEANYPKKRQACGDSGISHQPVIDIY
jgi:hypothetical protein